MYFTRNTKVILKSEPEQDAFEGLQISWIGQLRVVGSSIIPWAGSIQNDIKIINTI